MLADNYLLSTTIDKLVWENLTPEQQHTLDQHRALLISANTKLDNSDNDQLQSHHERSNSAASQNSDISQNSVATALTSQESSTDVSPKLAAVSASDPLPGLKDTQLSSSMMSAEYTLSRKEELIYNYRQQKARLDRGKKKYLEIQKGLLNTQKCIADSRAKINHLNGLINRTEPIVKAMSSQLIEAETRHVNSIQESITHKNNGSPNIEKNINSLSQKLGKELGNIFDIKRRRRRTNSQHSSSRSKSSQPSPSIETYISFMMIPNYLKLGQYEYTLINATTDRIAYFCQYLAYYLHIQLPYSISLPQPGSPYVSIGITVNGDSKGRSAARHRKGTYSSGHSRGNSQMGIYFDQDSTMGTPGSATFVSVSSGFSSTSSSGSSSGFNSGGYSNERHNSITKQKLVLTNQLHKLMEADKIREFEGYSTGLAMLILDLAYLASVLGIPIDEKMARKTSSSSSESSLPTQKQHNAHSVHHRPGSSASISTVESLKRTSSLASSSGESVATVSMIPSAGRQRRESSAVDDSSPIEDHQGSSLHYNSRRKSVNNGESATIKRANTAVGGTGLAGRIRWSHSHHKNSSSSGNSSRPESVVKFREQVGDDDQSKKKEGIEYLSSKEIEKENELEEERATRLLRVDKILVAIQKVLLNDKAWPLNQVVEDASSSQQTHQQPANTIHAKRVSLTGPPPAGGPTTTGGIWGIGSALWNYSSSSTTTNSNSPSPRQTSVEDQQQQQQHDSHKLAMNHSSPSQALAPRTKSPLNGIYSGLNFSQFDYQWPNVITVRDIIVTRNLQTVGGGGTSLTEWNLVESGDFE